MKFFLTFILCVFEVILFYGQKTSSADITLRKVYEKLNSAKFLSYDLTRESDFSSEDYKNTVSWKCYLDLDKKENILGFNFQIDNLQFKEIYNGTEYFELNKKNKTLQVAEQISNQSFDSKSYFYNSLITLRNVLPLIITDDRAVKSVKDFVVDKKQYKIITVDVGKRRISNLGNRFDEMTTEHNFIYELMINERSSLPLHIIQKNNINKDFIKTIFKNIELRPKKMSESAWFYSTYLNEYKLFKDENKASLIGSVAKDFKLKLYNEDNFVLLNDFKGNVVLLDFWIKNCTGCIESVSHLNELQNRFKDKKFKIISINSYDSQEKIEWFQNRYQVKYPILIDGKKVADKYGVAAYPTFVLINQYGEIISVREGFNDKIAGDIENEMKKL